MEKTLKNLLKTLKMNENLMSTILGGLIVLIMAGLVFNYFRSINKNGQIPEQASVDVSASPTPAKTEKLPTKYLVKKGDDLWHIAEKFYGSGYNYVDIMAANKISKSGTIHVDNELIIPEVKAKVATTTDDKQIKTDQAVKTEAGSLDGSSYTTVKGDHLWGIAVRAYGDGYQWVKIYNANKAKIGANPSVLEKNVVLELPR